ncbi:MAG: single-stranded DNA-binding protein [Acidobacteria bacterium]|nr:single-stranded DNA-binding protein [Acidobacteriota bacterium]
MSANVSILGNAGRDVSLRHSENGTAIASFPIASNSFKNTREGRVQVTHWYEVTAFGKTAETIAEHVKKGSSLLVHGRVSFKPWTTDRGDPRSGAEVALLSFEFVGGNRSDEQRSEANGTGNLRPAVSDHTGLANADSQVPEPAGASQNGAPDQPADEPYVDQF